MTDAELDERVADLVLRYDMLPAHALDRASAFQRDKAGTLAGALSALHLVPPESIRALLEEVTGVRALDPSLVTVYPDFVERTCALVPGPVLQGLHAFPAQMEVNRLHVCLVNPTHRGRVSAIETLSGCRVEPLVSTETSIAAALTQHYRAHIPSPPNYTPDLSPVAEETYHALLAADLETYVDPAVSLINRYRDALVRDPSAVDTLIREPQIIRLTQQIICRAIESGASDIHMEPTGSELRIRTRVDGALRVLCRLPSAMGMPVAARLKAMADLPTAVAPTPVDGRIGYDLVWGRAVDLRFSLVPSILGEKIVLRVLDRSRNRRALSDLGVDPPTQLALEQASDLPNGLLLVTGPTGSGKSSTLYALLDRLNDETLSIVTAEDPVESAIGGLTQVQCEPAHKLSYAEALKSFLRQDPDVIMVGEVRDAETADIALKAALTGHLVISTLHTNDAPGAVLRLLNMGLEPFVISSALRLVVAQRLLRRLCSSCKRTATRLDSVERIFDELPHPPTGTVYEPTGCERCGGTGYRGRTGIFEILRISPAIEQLILDRASSATIRTQAQLEGMRTLRQAGLLKVLGGDTSIAEVLEHTVSSTLDESS